MAVQYEKHVLIYNAFESNEVRYMVQECLRKRDQVQDVSIACFPREALLVITIYADGTPC